MTTKQVQCLLTYLGYDPGPIDGEAGQRTADAVSRFQGVEGLDRDGSAGAQTQEKLLEAVAAGRLYQPQPENKTGTWWDEIRYFTPEEFRCKCGGRYCDGYPAQMQEAAVRIAEAARAHFGRPAHVVSGLRCKQWNAHEGGVWNSQHQDGEAIDLRIEGVDSETLRQFVSQQPGHRYSYRINSTNVHFDIPRVQK